jgi:hypothetical protein
LIQISNGNLKDFNVLNFEDIKIMSPEVVLMKVYWKINKNLNYESRKKNELDRLAQEIVDEIKTKGHAKDLGGPVCASPYWEEIISPKATGAVNVLLCLGGTIMEIEYILRQMYILDKSLFKKWGNFLDNQRGTTEKKILEKHVKFMAIMKNGGQPAKGFVFESNHPLSQLANNTYVRAIGTWQKNTEPFLIGRGELDHPK